MAITWTSWQPWQLNDAGVVLRVFRLDDGSEAVSLHHPQRPWRVELPAGVSPGTVGFAERVRGLQGLADYLDETIPALGFEVPPGSSARRYLNLMADSTASEWGFGWLRPDGFGSTLRALASGQEFRLSLRAGNRWLDGSEPRALGGGVALRLDLLLQDRSGTLTLDVVGSAASRPGGVCREPLANFTRETLGPRLGALGQRLQHSLGLVQPPRFTGLRLDGAAPERWRAVAGIGTLADGRAIQFEADLQLEGGTLLPRLRSRSLMITHATKPVFTGSPPKKQQGHSGYARPSRDPASMKESRSTTNRLPSAGDLKEPPSTTATPRWQVHRSAVAHRDPAQASQLAKTMMPPTGGVRSDLQSELNAAMRGDEFFRRIDAYGLFAAPAIAGQLGQLKLPLELRPRAPLFGAPDGDTVNAEVRVRVPADPNPPGQWPMPMAHPAPVEVRFGAGVPSHREWHPGPHGRPTAQALGIAADERWAWHEFGHVLVYAATGRLELPFAHGIGDALAVLVSAPDSPLAEGPGDAGASFPWINNGRRHDRDARLGWCWCGRRSALRHSGFGNRAQRAGYFEEQLFSSAMHRAYLALGGGERGLAALERRRSASDYLVYLLMRGVLDLPPHQIEPTPAVEWLLDAMVTEDQSLSTWEIDADWPESLLPRKIRRTGGRAHKVLRWAFEQQGLHEDAAPGEVVEGPATPRVDLYIEDRRAQNHLERAGHYTPVPVRWPLSNAETLPWMAGDAGISRNGDLIVTVQNRGREGATGVEVRAWWATSNAGAPLAWQALALVNPSVPPAAIGSAGATLSVRFKMPVQSGVPAADPFWVFAAVSCMADPANIDNNLPLGTGEPPTDTVDLAELVALDNNCALRLFDD
jgi:hypothetical protein